MQNHLLPQQIFREYDIRGLVGTELVLDQIYPLGSAIAYYFKQQNPDIKTVALGMDGRIHSAQIKATLTQALTDSGLDVLFVGLCHSPAVYFALHTMPVDAGLMITASHNPKEYNGIKICLGKNSVWGKALQEIYQLYKAGNKLDVQQKGTYKEQPIIESYVDWLVEHFAHLRNRSFPVVIDCGNGAGGSVMPLLVDKMGFKQVKLLYAEVDGTYPHHEADPTHIENMRDAQAIMQQDKLQCAIGLDGDADRMAVMTKSGRLVAGDQLLGLFAQSVLTEHKDAAVVCDVKASAVVIAYLKSLGATVVISPCGHSIIKNEMKKYNALLAGELSCHFFFADRYFGYDDGVYALLRLLELMHDDEDLDTMLNVYPHTFTSPEIRIACAEDKKKLVIQTVTDIFAQKRNATLLTIDGVRAEMPFGWGLLRASNTQPMLSLRFESATQEGLDHIKQEFMKAMAPFYAQDQLAQAFSKE